MSKKRLTLIDLQYLCIDGLHYIVKDITNSIAFEIGQPVPRQVAYNLSNHKDWIVRITRI